MRQGEGTGIVGITYSTDHPVTREQVADLFRRAPLRRPVDDPERIGKMLSGADLVVTAWDGNRLVGIARSLTDFCYACYLSDLAVDPDCQKQGIGRELIRRTREAIGEETMLLLLAAPTAADYYAHVGFEYVENAWMIQRTR